ncbi:hypothetical protein ACTI_69300 [Actinoplanes sp. OR16]|uniref:PAS domain-containing protein n=1 Tax=Actinoplanes sp. OR16 TaxID=946334 RepID=UPI000F70D525|nr:PAS domain-containing protein [Actinoplanes sp. OR16]BBH70245.1 hypothetical protein ACTI_69300 [Actinoplanes sp. OR16]
MDTAAREVEELAADLRELRARAGSPSLQAMARAGHSSPPTLSAVHAGRRFPTWEATSAYLRGCGVTEQADWQVRWCRVADAVGYRGERPVTVNGNRGPCPTPENAMTAAEFRARLREVYRWTGAVSQAAFVRAAGARGVRMPRATLSDLLADGRAALPSGSSVRIFLSGSGLPPQQVERWVTVHDGLCRVEEDLFEDAPCGYLTTAPDGTILQVNRTFLRWTGYDRPALVGRLRFRDLLSVGSRIYHETHCAPLLSARGTIHEIAFDVMRADGRRMSTLMNSTVTRDVTGTPKLIRITLFDAGERRRYEQELLNARRAAEEELRRLRQSRR